MAMDGKKHLQSRNANKKRCVPWALAAGHCGRAGVVPGGSVYSFNLYSRYGFISQTTTLIRAS